MDRAAVEEDRVTGTQAFLRPFRLADNNAAVHKDPLQFPVPMPVDTAPLKLAQIFIVVGERKIRCSMFAEFPHRFVCDDLGLLHKISPISMQSPCLTIL